MQSVMEPVYFISYKKLLNLSPEIKKYSFILGNINVIFICDDKRNFTQKY
jgi:hypothetical protein